MPGVVLIDTDVLIDVAGSVEQAVEHLERIEESQTPATSIISRMELIVGCRNKKELREVDRFLLRFAIIGLSELAAEAAADLLRRFRLSHGLLIPDALIAATAVVEEIPFLTKNQRDYRFIEELDLLPYS